MPVLSKVDLNVKHVTTAQPPCFLEATTDGEESRSRGSRGPLVARVVGCYLDKRASCASCCLSAECPCSQKLVRNSGNGPDPRSYGGRSSRHT